MVKVYRFILILTFVVIMFRVVICYYPGNTQSFYLYYLYLQSNYVATIANQIIIGEPLPLFGYLHNPYELGVLFMGLFYCPFSIIFGNGNFVIALVACLITLVMAFLLWKVTYKYLGLATANIALIIFIFPPPSFSVQNHLIHGSHYESIIFSLCTLLLFYQIFFEKNKTKDTKLVIFFTAGFVLSFGMSLFYIFACFVIALSFTCLVFIKPQVTIKQWVVFIAGTLIGTIPWFWYGFVFNFTNLKIHGSNLLTHFQSKGFLAVIFKIFKSFFVVLPESFGFLYTIGPIFNYAYFALLIYALYWIIFKVGSIKTKVNPRQFIMLLIMIYLLVFFVMYAVTDFDTVQIVKSIYLCPLYPFICIAMAIFIKEQYCSNKFFGKTIFVIILSICIFSQVVFYKDSKLLKCLYYKSVLPELLGEQIIVAYETSGGEIVDDADDLIKVKKYFNLKEKYYPILEVAFARSLAEKCYAGLIHLKPAQLIKTIEPKYWPDFLRGWGMLAANPRCFKTTDEINKAAVYIDKNLQNFFYEGVGIAIGIMNPVSAEKCIKNIEQFDRKYRFFCYKGLGYQRAMFIKERKDLYMKEFAIIPIEYQMSYWKGVLDY